MSLEQALERLTAAVEANTAALSGGEAKKTTRGKGAAKDEAGNPPASATASPAQQTVQAAASPATTAAVAGPSLKEVADALMALAGKKREAAVAILKEYGVEKLSLIAPEKLGEVQQKIAAAEAALAQPAQSSSLV